ncbi:MAG: VOC family protein [Acidobacteria bacterium]|nr:VOC family protein [Acidobacteriota bacterium]
MPARLSKVTLVVHDYDAAIHFFTQKLGFDLIEDRPMGEKRWVVVQPKAASSALLLARASDPQQTAAIGNQTGGRVAFFLETDDFWRDYTAFTARGVRFLEEPREETYGTVAVFEDCCGNTWDLIQPREASN